MPIKKALLILLLIAAIGSSFIWVLYYFNNKATEIEIENHKTDIIMTEEIREKNQVKNMNENLVETKKVIEEVRASSTMTTNDKEKFEREAMLETLRKLNSMKN